MDASPARRAGGRRTLDIDLLLYGSMVDPALRLPRADVLWAAHVLRPLAELAPTLRHPVTGQPFCEAWALHASADLPWTRAGRIMTTPLPEQPGSVVQPQPIAAAE